MCLRIGRPSASRSEVRPTTSKAPSVNVTITRAGVASVTEDVALLKPKTGEEVDTVVVVGIIAEKDTLMKGVMVVEAVIKVPSRMVEARMDVIVMGVTIMRAGTGRAAGSTETHPVKKRVKAASITRSTDPLLYIFIYRLY